MMMAGTVIVMTRRVSVDARKLKMVTFNVEKICTI